MYRFEIKDADGEWVLLEENDYGPNLQKSFDELSATRKILRVVESDTGLVIPLVNMKCTVEVGSDQYPGHVVQVRSVSSFYIWQQGEGSGSILVTRRRDGKFKVKDSTKTVVLGEAVFSRDPDF